MTDTFLSLPVALARKGWSFDGEFTYFGHYHTSLGAFEGKVAFRAGDYQAYIKDPPAVLMESPRRACLVPAGGDWLMIDYHDRLPGVLAVLRAVEGFIEREKQWEDVGELYDAGYEEYAGEWDYEGEIPY